MIGATRKLTTRSCIRGLCVDLNLLKAGLYGYAPAARLRGPMRLPVNAEGGGRSCFPTLAAESGTKDGRANGDELRLPLGGG